MAPMIWYCPQCGHESDDEGFCEEHLTALQRRRPENARPAPAPTSRLVLELPWGQQLDLPDDGALVVGRSSDAFRGHPRAQEADQVSRVHARFFRDEKGELWVQDLHSANHTYVDGMELDPDVPTIIQAGQVVRLAQDIDCPVLALDEFGEPMPTRRTPHGGDDGR